MTYTLTIPKATGSQSNLAFHVNNASSVMMAGITSAKTLPDGFSYAEGALLEPLSVVMRGIQVARLNLGRGVVVCGAGPIGLIALAAARASGAHPIVITDVELRRLAFAKEIVPSCITYQVDLAKDAQDNALAIRALFGDSEYVAPEAVLECTGVESSVCTAAYTARRGGVVVVIGVGKATMNNLPFMHMSLAEVRFTLNLGRIRANDG
ncbi:hypothetical protein ACP6JC_003666 [Aspergillus fumigatus]